MACAHLVRWLGDVFASSVGSYKAVRARTPLQRVARHIQLKLAWDSMDIARYMQYTKGEKDFFFWHNICMCEVTAWRPHQKQKARGVLCAGLSKAFALSRCWICV